MKGDLKKKFLDILFEQDPEDEEYSEPKQIKEEKKEVVKENKTVPSAREVLYQDKKQSSFIDYEETPKKKTEEVKKEAAPVKKAVQPVVKDDDKDYVIKGNVSPIFGEIEEPKKEKKVVKSDKAARMNPSIYSTKEFTGGVISPIFGYDSKEADKAREIFEVNKDKDEKEDSEDVVDDIDLYDEPISLFEEDFEEPYVDETVFNEEVEPLSEYENTKNVKKESEDIEDLIDDTFEFDTLDKKKKD